MTDQVVLAMFPGIDLLGRGFEEEGFCVVRGPDLLWGGDVRRFHPPAARFDGVIGGSPCQDFSGLRRSEPTGLGVEMLREFLRVVDEGRPAWFLLENVPRVPDVRIDGYRVQRIDLRGAEVGLKQRRFRHFQFGYAAGGPLIVARVTGRGETEPACIATATKSKQRRAWGDFCELMGLPRTFELPGMTMNARYRAVGNGVPVPMARLLASSIRARCDSPGSSYRVCICGCGRIVHGQQNAAGPACRKRIERQRRGNRPVIAWRDSAGVTGSGTVTIDESQKLFAGA